MQLRITRTPDLETRSSSSSICPRQRAIACRSAHTFAMRVWRVAVAERIKGLTQSAQSSSTEFTEGEPEGNILADNESGRRADTVKAAALRGSGSTRPPHSICV